MQQQVAACLVTLKFKVIYNDGSSGVLEYSNHMEPNYHHIVADDGGGYERGYADRNKKKKRILFENQPPMRLIIFRFYFLYRNLGCVSCWPFGGGLYGAMVYTHLTHIVIAFKNLVYARTSVVGEVCTEYFKCQQ